MFPRGDFGGFGDVFVGLIPGTSGGSWRGSLSPLCHPQITQHYSKPRVTPLEVMPVFPDFKVRGEFRDPLQNPIFPPKLPFFPSSNPPFSPIISPLLPPSFFPTPRFSSSSNFPTQAPIFSLFFPRFPNFSLISP